MKILKIVLILLLFTNILFAKTNEATLKLMEFRDKSQNSFDVNIEVKYKIWTLMGEPVVDARAKYSIGQFVDVDGKSYEVSKLPKDIVNKLRIYDLQITTPFESKVSYGVPLQINIDMGVMSKVNKWSFNTPSSSNWDKWIMYKSGTYLTKEKAIKSYKGFYQLGFGKGYGSLSKATNIKYDVTALREYLNTKNKKSQTSNNREKKKIKKFITKKTQEVENRKLPKELKDVWIDKDTGLMWQDEKYSQDEIDNYIKYYKNGKSIGKTGSWYHAEKYCKNLKLNDFQNWRLATLNELDNIKDKRNNFETKKEFRGTWSSSIQSSKSFIFSFVDYDKNDKTNWAKDKSSIEFIRCVREMK